MTPTVPPRVAHLTSAHPRDDVRIFAKQCRTLAAAGYEVHLVAPGDRDEEIEGVHVHAVRSAGTSRFRRMTGTVLAVYRVARRLDADVYHLHDPELWPLAPLLRRGGKRVIYDSHEHLPEQILTKPWIPRRARRPVARIIDAGERLMARSVSAVVTVEPYVRDRFAATAHRTVTVGNFPMLAEFPALNGDWSSRERAVCYAGGITEIRAAREMVQATANTDASLLMAGWFSPPALEEEVSREPGWRQVEFLGRVARDQVVEMMSRARAGLLLFHEHPHHVSANPTKMFEYMSAGLPVIASDFPAWRDFVQEHDCGICVDPTDPAAIGEAIEWVLDHPDEAQRMGANGRRAVERGYTWESERATLLELYEELLDARNGAGAASDVVTGPTAVHLTVVHAPDDTRILVKECASLASVGYSVHLVAPGTEDRTVHGVRIHALGAQARNRLLRMTGTVLRAFRTARRLDADVYHLHDPELLPVGLMLRMLGKPVIYDAHEHFPRQILTKPWIPRALRRPTALVAGAAERMASRLLSAVVTAEPVVQGRFQRMSTPSVLVNNYPMLEEFPIAESDWDEREHAVCYVGEVGVLRGANEMVEAIARTDARLLLAGRIVPSTLADELERHPGWKQVEALGHLDRSGVARVLGRARAGLVVLAPVPNYTQANATKMFEYMSAGIPVIASDFPTWGTIVREHGCGLCVDPTSPVAIAEAVEWILEHPEEAQRMGANGRRAVERFYSWDVEERTLLALYEKLVSR
jgi:glycosyltransferase involved in cell wall biosynthesis